MTFKIRHRRAVAAVAASFASLLCAGGALAQTAPSSATVQAGPVWSAGNATAQAGPLAIDITSASVGLGVSLYAGTEPGQADGEAGAGTQDVAVTMDPQLVALQGRLCAARRKLRAAVESGRAAMRADARALRARVRKLQRRATRLAARVREQAIAEARAAANGTWLVVDGPGTIISQSGGMTVSHVSRGVYDVSFDAGTTTCLSSGAESQVHVTGPNGPVDGGFFLAAAC
jgi:hypothetical protein